MVTALLFIVDFAVDAAVGSVCVVVVCVVEFEFVAVVVIVDVLVAAGDEGG